MTTHTDEDSASHLAVDSFNLTYKWQRCLRDREMPDKLGMEGASVILVMQGAET